ncbi:hypothetical protein AC578_9242 [Pseudocercospora eumusae]|uniref:Cell wall protein PhiA n=1 Tax=Pseudocercospora eumusae TaxID=321146 RepID=A0A139HNI9_9PEZI|nr:hypothetical protein AC578_9242 [Pseudocercospora eumusae]
MFPPTLSVAAVLAATTNFISAAVAQNTPAIVVPVAPTYNVPFGIEAAGKDLGAAPIQLTASGGRIYIGGKQDPPTNCSSPQTVHDFATFVWHSDKTLWLYTQDPLHTQQVWAMSPDGLTGYATAKEQRPDDGLTPFEIDSNTRVVTFKGVGAKACPTDSTKPGQYGVWFSNAEKPGNLNGCVSVDLKAYKAEARDACTYSHLPSCDEAPKSCGGMMV